MTLFCSVAAGFGKAVFLAMNENNDPQAEKSNAVLVLGDKLLLLHEVPLSTVPLDLATWPLHDAWPQISAEAYLQAMHRRHPGTLATSANLAPALRGMA